MESYDVVIVGYGPVGRLLAVLLGRGGHRVLVLEQQQTSYPLPRAAHHDDEIGRILQGVGLAPSSMPDVTEPYDDFYEWQNQNGETLLRLDWRGRGPSGWNVSNFFHQPALEAKLESLVDGMSQVEVRWGHRVCAVDTGAGGRGGEVVADVKDQHGTRYTVGAAYLLGADGANSSVREWIGTELEDLGYFHDWLVVDVVPNTTFQVEPRALQSCDPKRPTTLVPSGPHGRRRWEFMRLPDEDPAEFATADTAWHLLGRWGLSPANAALERHALYTFQASWAARWRRGRLLLAGDSAHLMPPFAGQGMCAGFRDATNLAWKLDLVLRGAPDELLDTYEPERIAHVREFIAFAMDLGRVICITDPAQARQRDERLKADLAAGAAPPPVRPRLGPGLHRGDVDPCAGTLAIQAPVRGEHGAGLLDDVTGLPGALIGTVDALGPLDDGRRAALRAIGIEVVAITDGPGDGRPDGVVVDVEGAYAAWLTHHDADAILVRPDYYVYGAARAGTTAVELTDEFLAGIAG